MKGLIIKDLYQLAKYCRSFLIILVIFLAASAMNQNNWFFLFYPSLLCGMIPVTLLAYDERSHWDRYALSLPVTRRQIVTGKYVIGLGTILVSLLLSLALSAVRMGKTGSFSAGDLFSLGGAIFLSASLTASVTLPFMFKMGVEKGRVIYYVVIGAMTALIFLVSGAIPGMEQAGASAVTGTAGTNAAGASSDIPAVLLFVLGLAAIAVSRALSVKFYEKRELG